MVKWKGYTFEECTWEPEANFKRQTIDLYNRRRKEEREEESDSDDERETMMTAAAVKKKTATAAQNGTSPRHETCVDMDVEDIPRDHEM